MKLYDTDYDKVQSALTDGVAVCAITADGDGNICINPQIDRNNEFINSWNVAIMIVYKNGITRHDRDDEAGVIEIYKTEDTSLDSMRDVIDIFLTLAKPGSIEIV